MELELMCISIYLDFNFMKSTLKATIENSQTMNNVNLNEGNSIHGLLMTCLTVFLYALSSITLNQGAAICTMLAALSTVALNLRRWFKK